MIAKVFWVVARALVSGSYGILGSCQSIAWWLLSGHE